MELVQVNCDYTINEEFKQLFEKINTTQDAILIEHTRAENSIVKKVISILLNRDATSDDTKDCELKIKDSGEKILYYQNRELGIIKTFNNATKNPLNYGTRVSVKFIPTV